MASPDVSASYRSGGTLFLGGTAAGVVHEMRFSPGLEYVRLEEEERGEVFNVLYRGGNPLVMVRFVAVDADAMPVVWPNSRTATGSEIVQWPGSDKGPGELMDDLGVLLRVTADDTSAYSIVLYNAIPLVVNEETQFSHREPLSYVAMFIGIRDGSDKIGELGPEAKLTAP